MRRNDGVPTRRGGWAHPEELRQGLGVLYVYIEQYIVETMQLAPKGASHAMAVRDPQDLLPLAPLSYQLLISLAEGDNHGYGLMKDVRERTGARISPATGTVYLALQRLADDGLIGDAPRRRGADEDARRRYYRMTAFGRRVAAADAERLLGLVRQAADARLISPPQLRPRPAGGRQR